jgi:hypothetical protein
MYKDLMNNCPFTDEELLLIKELAEVDAWLWHPVIYSSDKGQKLVFREDLFEQEIFEKLQHALKQDQGIFTKEYGVKFPKWLVLVKDLFEFKAFALKIRYIQLKFEKQQKLTEAFVFYKTMQEKLQKKA